MICERSEHIIEGESPSPTRGSAAIAAEGEAANDGRPTLLGSSHDDSTDNGGGEDNCPTTPSLLDAESLPSSLTDQQGGASGDANNSTSAGVHQYHSEISDNVLEDHYFVTRFERDNAAQISVMLAFGLTRTKTLQIVAEQRPTLEMVEALIQLSGESSRPTVHFVSRADLGKWPTPKRVETDTDPAFDWSHSLPNIRDDDEMKMRLEEFARTQSRTQEQIEREYFAGKNKKAVADW